MGNTIWVESALGFSPQLFLMGLLTRESTQFLRFLAVLEKFASSVDCGKDVDMLGVNWEPVGRNGE